jgi:5-keto-L-gluconate epimerase
MEGSTMVGIALFTSPPDLTGFASADLYGESVRRWAREAASLGADGVEPAFGGPTTLSAEVIEEALEAAGIKMVSVNTVRLFREGLSLLDPRPAIRRDEALSKLKYMLRLGHRFHCPVNVGLFRGRALEGKPIAYSKDLLVDVLKSASDFAETLPAALILETTNRFETNIMYSTDEGLEIIRRVDSPSLRMLLDTYHMYIEDENLEESIVKAKDYVRHFHFKNVNGSAPGAGDNGLDFRSIVRRIKSIGFDGFVSVGMEATQLPAGAPGSVAWLRDVIATA